MQQYCVLYDGESESCSSHLAASSFVYAVEAFEESFEVFVWHTRSVVGKGEVPFAVFFLSAYGHRRSLAGIGDGIVGKVAEHAV